MPPGCTRVSVTKSVVGEGKEREKISLENEVCGWVHSGADADQSGNAEVRHSGVKWELKPIGAPGGWAVSETCPPRKGASPATDQ